MLTKSNRMESLVLEILSVKGQMYLQWFICVSMVLDKALQ